MSRNLDSDERSGGAVCKLRIFLKLILRYKSILDWMAPGTFWAQCRHSHSEFKVVLFCFSTSNFTGVKFSKWWILKNMLIFKNIKFLNKICFFGWDQPEPCTLKSRHLHFKWKCSYYIEGPQKYCWRPNVTSINIPPSYGTYNHGQ